MRKLGWENENKYYVELMGYDSIHSIRYFKRLIKYNTNIKVISQWSIYFKKNKLIASNNYYEENLWDPSGYNTLTTDESDTSFWNVIKILKQYCNVRDTTYIIEING